MKVNIIRRVQVTCLDDTGLERKGYFRLNNAEEVNNMADVLKNYHIIEIKPATTINGELEDYIRMKQK